jgi:hypothetical protein
LRISKDQIKSLTDINLKLNEENEKITERLLAIENPIKIASKSKILKKDEYQLLKLWLRVDFDLELIYSSYANWDNISDLCKSSSYFNCD